MDSTAVWSYHLLRLAAPTMITGVEILFRLGCQCVRHKKLLGTERAAKSTLNPSACVEFASTFVSFVYFVCHFPSPTIRTLQCHEVSTITR
jgi:hypothetical protein